MITEKDLQEAIAECEGVRNPTANTCIKLAAFYTLREHLFPENAKSLTSTEQIPMGGYSSAAPPKTVETTIDYYSDTDFGRAIDGRKASDVWPLIDELAEAVKVVNPRLYVSFMRKLE